MHRRPVARPRKNHISILDPSSNRADEGGVRDSKRTTTAAPAREDVGTVRASIQQNKPFRSDAQEALLTLLMTTEKLHWPYEELFAEHDLTAQQFNVLRILRGAGKEGLPTLDVAARMVQRTPGITRLIDRLEKKGLVTRERAPEDRRQVWCYLSREGASLLRRLDAPVADLDERSLHPLGGEEVRRLIRLLDKVRTAT